MGRPRKYKTPEDMQVAIDEYFNVGLKPTVCGLALYLGFADRQSILDYQAKDDFTCTVKRAKMRIQQYYEEHLVNNNAAGSIFALKNFGWTDKQEYAIAGNLTVNIKN